MFLMFILGASKKLAKGAAATAALAKLHSGAPDIVVYDRSKHMPLHEDQERADHIGR